MQFSHPRAAALLFAGALAAGQAAFWLTPHQSFSAREKRALAEPPAVSLSAAADGSLAEAIDRYCADHFPGREGWVGAHAYLTQAEGRGAVQSIVCGRDGWLFPAPLADARETLHKNMQALERFAQAQSVPVTLLAVPTAGAVVEDKLPARHLAYPDAALLEEARRLTGSRLRWVEVLEPFRRAPQPEALYYRTDHHWTSEGAYRAYGLLRQAQGAKAAPREAFTVERSAGFYGTSYAKSGLWATPPDTLELWTNPARHTVTSVFDGNRTTPVTQEGMLFREYLSQADQYPVFLSGNHARVRIQTDADTDRRLLVVKDSYAHALAPFLAEDYRTIDLIDLRYFKRESISDWLQDHPADEVLFVYGMQSLVTDKSLQWLE